jgi:hypothetical protein
MVKDGVKRFGDDVDVSPTTFVLIVAAIGVEGSARLRPLTMMWRLRSRRGHFLIPAFKALR